MTYFEKRASVEPIVAKKASSAPSGRSILRQRRRQDLRRWEIEEIEQIPAQDAVDALGHVLQARLQILGEGASPLPFGCRSRSANRSSRMILQPRRSPKNVTFEPTTGPRSIRTGDSRDVRLARNLRRAFVGNGWPASATAAAGAAASFRSLLRRSQSN